MYTRFCNQRGFTLPELLVVIAIIGILSASGYAYFANAKAQARDRVRATTLEELRVALEQYKDKYGRYPLRGCGVVTSGQWVGSEASYTSSNVTSCPSDYIQGLAPEFIPELPHEIGGTKINRGYAYIADNLGVRYKLIVHHAVEILRVDSTEHPLAHRPSYCSTPSISPGIYNIYSDEVSACW